MTARAQRTAVPPPAVRWRSVLVLALLAGVFAMHALGPGGGAGHTSAVAPAHRTMTAVADAHQPMTAVADASRTMTAVADAGTRADAGRHGGGHLRHADQTCASGAVNGGPSLPGLAVGPVVDAAPAGAAPGRRAAAPDGARAPPSLAELQLLRI
ncbi:DUF6153 family protein [Streptomyces sp. DSM 41014]|uniref:DUF6153 family protein n=1 Tax=Streptomyces hintoniae TaxID=3075521 RepID=A0ABU2US66_9ACTN|nr:MULTISPECIES: DUF6153 family protein [unclassified Streptomyces]MDH6701315.1 hypothetical protein [Streptomyces sp. MAA16]MDT0476024.1 DUF6153 family protein [Streptomyces sp. DSM 41014]